MGKIIFVNAYEYSYIGTRVLASYLRRFGHKTHNILLGADSGCYVQTIDDDHHGYLAIWKGKLASNIANVYPISDKDINNLKKVIKDECPDIIGFSARSTNNHLVPCLVPIFREAAPSALLVAGGYGPSLEPELYLDGGFDVVLRGDGEESLLELIQYYDEKDYTRATNIKNSCWNKKYGGKYNVMRDQEKYIEKYPAQIYGHKYFSVIAGGEIKRYYDPMIDSKTYYTYLGRGCTGKCTYCSGGNWREIYRKDKKKSFPRRNRKYRDVIDELVSLPESIEFVLFNDEFWSLSLNQTAEFFQLYKKEVNKPFHAYLHYEQMVKNPNLFQLAIDAGLSWTGIGFQTGSADFMRKYYGRNPQFEIMIEYANMLYENYIACTAQFISGNCYETWEDFLQTLAMIRKLPFDIESPEIFDISVSRLRPHPKTPLTIIAPRVLTDPMPASEWLYRAMIMYLANKMDENDLNDIININMFKNNPLLLIDFAQGYIYRKQRQYYENLLDDGVGDDWIFYGCGENYQRNKEFFLKLKPRVILIDSKFIVDTKKIDNIPIVSTDDFFASNDCDAKSRYFIFVIHKSYGYPIAKKLLHQYKVPKKNIHHCEIDIFANGIH